MAYLPKISTIVLDTRDITEANDINDNRSDFVFRNINFDILLGEDWRTYDLFNLVLTSTVFDITDHLDTNDDPIAPTLIVPEVRLTGLPFVDSDLRVNTKTQEIALCTVGLTNITTEPNIVYYPSGVVWTFNRADRGLVNIHVRLVDPTTNMIDSDAKYPHQQYIFKVYHI